MTGEPVMPSPEGTLDDTDTVAGGLLRDLMRTTGLSLAEVARQAELPLLVMADWTTSRTQPTLGALIRVVEACGLEMRLHLDTKDRHDLVLPRRVDPEQMRRFAAEERTRVARLRTETDGVTADLEQHLPRQPNAHPTLAQIAQARAALDGSPLADRSDLFERAAAEMIEKPDADVGDVLRAATALYVEDTSQHM